MKLEGRKIRRLGAGRKQAIAPDLPPLSTDASLSLATRVYMTLRLALMTGGLLPGTTLTSRSLSQALKVSAMPVRDALKRLEVEGALTSKSKSAFFVRDPDQTEFAELLEVRLSLEGLAIEKAAMACRPEHLERIRQLNDTYQALTRSGGADAGKALISNFHFHFEIYALSGSDALIELIEANWLRVGPVLNRFTAPTGNLGRSMHAHEEILVALERNDPSAAVHALRVDLTSAFEEIQPQLRPNQTRQPGVISERLTSLWRAD